MIALAGVLQKAEEKQRQLEQAKEEWIRGVSHDLKTPLSYVTGYSALLAQPDYAWSEEEKHQFVQELVAKSEYMGELIGDLNRSFHLENVEQEMPMDPEVFPVYEFVQQVTADIANNPRAFTYNFELSADLNAKNALLNGDRKLLYRAFANLLMNAVQHNAQHTEIHVAIAAKSEKHVRITIRDNGAGIPEEVFSQLHDLQPNVLTERLAGSEHGLGLVIARKMIEAHDGTLSVRSQMGQGTTLHILLNRHG
ncbi:HAMP domain-containing histidine kinase [Paenibacillus sp. MZ04-78.2]|uniref:sensor histidine kinase n=1 Tax=Paenibacillus sp. MZ04-78.2 TaxID=2962034 RepID=UPI0020B741E5|nr:HAMP domain-containing sensor histidine kinase [Paenibacillus sp. MZ04-78.2]MCP3773532.1 HAMP domain-containing histidine kinase [Paenibacillus sp. MZ04-78.2]